MPKNQMASATTNPAASTSMRTHLGPLSTDKLGSCTPASGGLQRCSTMRCSPLYDGRCGSGGLAVSRDEDGRLARLSEATIVSP